MDSESDNADAHGGWDWDPDTAHVGVIECAAAQRSVARDRAQIDGDEDKVQDGHDFADVREGGLLEDGCAIGDEKREASAMRHEPGTTGARRPRLVVLAKRRLATRRGDVLSARIPARRLAVVLREKLGEFYQFCPGPIDARRRHGFVVANRHLATRRRRHLFSATSNATSRSCAARDDSQVLPVAFRAVHRQQHDLPS